MKRKRHTPEQIIAKLREADAALAAGKTAAEVAKALGVAEATYHRWRHTYGGMKGPEMKRLKELEKENARLRDELLAGELFTSLIEAKILVEQYLREYNTYRPHRSLGNRTPAEFAASWSPSGSASLRLRETSCTNTPHVNPLS